MFKLGRRNFRMNPLTPSGRTWLMVVTLAACGLPQADVRAGAGANSRFYYKNLTHTAQHLEVNPRFIQNGEHVLFLVFTGDPQAPKPWDYVLTKADRDGQVAHYLSSRGVLDYTVLNDETGVLVLKAVFPEHRDEPLSTTPYEEIREWELWYISFESGEEVLVESSMGLPLAEGYRILGLADLPNTTTGTVRSRSPKGRQEVLLRRERADGYWVFRYYLAREPAAPPQRFFTTESWVPVKDSEWWPSVLWLDDDVLLTLAFNSSLADKFPQSRGVFSIVRLDLSARTGEILYSAEDIRPYPKFALSPSGRNLYFQKQSGGETELWRLNLLNRSAEMLYGVEGDLGEVRISRDERSLVFTQQTDDNFDIIRLDIDSGRLQR